MQVKFENYVVTYPVVIHKDDDSTYGVTVPDLPGCFSAGSTMEEALANAKEAIECHIKGFVMDDEEVPEPLSIDTHIKNPDYKNGIWALVDFDYGKIDAPMKIKYKRINVTIPSHLLKHIDQYAKNKHLSRSAFITQATVNAMTDTK
ncbi:MAG: type II toxin-antitoxin system HicB family antitoxin [Acidobacteria bacterium]|nr:type II toxin-antitoxin system HicB family antitoxin [Acidobacteriota bacterium]